MVLPVKGHLIALYRDAPLFDRKSGLVNTEIHFCNIAVCFVVGLFWECKKGWTAAHYCNLGVCFTSVARQ